MTTKRNRRNRESDYKSAGSLTQPMEFTGRGNSRRIKTLTTEDWQNTTLSNVSISLFLQFWDNRLRLWDTLRSLRLTQAESYSHEDLVNACSWERTRIHRAFRQMLRAELKSVGNDRKREAMLELASTALKEVMLFELGGTDPDRNLTHGGYSPAAALESLRLALWAKPDMVLFPDDELHDRFYAFDDPQENTKPSLEWKLFWVPARNLMDAFYTAGITSFWMVYGKNKRRFHIAQVFSARNRKSLSKIVQGVKAELKRGVSEEDAELVKKYLDAWKEVHLEAIKEIEVLRQNRQSCYAVKVTNKQDWGEDPEKKCIDQAFADIADAQTSLTQRLQSRITQVVPDLDPKEMAWWQARIEEAQAVGLSDVEGFVKNVKKFLTVFDCRLENEEGVMLAPKINRDRHGTEYVQLTGTKNGKTVSRGFKKAKLKIVCQQSPNHNQPTPSSE